MKRWLVLDPAFLGATLAIGFLLLAEPSLAADAGCSSDSGIPSGVIAPLDVGHFRKLLADAGFAVGGFYLGEMWANSGGIHEGSAHNGVLWTYLIGDLHKAGLWKGLCFYADAYQIHGAGTFTADDIGSLAAVSNYEALPSTRLSELWLEQHMFNDHLTVRVGQLTADTEFLLSSGSGISSGSGNFLNATWGWASLASSDLPGEGPAYPLSTPAVRVALKPNAKFSLMVGVYNGNPAGAHCKGKSQVCDAAGIDFPIDTPPLLMAEGSYKYNQEGRLPGTVKIGGWNHFGTFHDQRFDSGGPIATTFNSGRPIKGDWAIYGIVDQLLWRVPDSKDPKGIGVFGRVIGAPTEQNLVDFYADGGVTFSGMIPHRSDDTLGIGLAYSGISSEAHGFDVNSSLPVARTYEALLEICYTAQLKTGWTLQPDFQYIWRPGGGVPEPSGKGTVENAAVWGLRTTINF
jgi:porin